MKKPVVFRFRDGQKVYYSAGGRIRKGRISFVFPENMATGKVACYEVEKGVDTGIFDMMNETELFGSASELKAKLSEQE